MYVGKGRAKKCFIRIRAAVRVPVPWCSLALDGRAGTAGETRGHKGRKGTLAWMEGDAKEQRHGPRGGGGDNKYIARA